MAQHWVCPKSPPCSALLEEPGLVLSTRSLWPKHLCAQTAFDSTELWARNDHRSWGRIAGEWPLPIGAEAARPYAGTSFGDVSGLAPFGGSERAALALRMLLADGVLDV